MWASPPTLKTHVVFVGADAHIGPEADGTTVSVFSDRSGDLPHGAMRASPPTLKTHVVFVGADAHIGPEADGMGVSVFSDRSGNAPGGAMRASPPTLKTHVVFAGNAPYAENAHCFCRGRCPLGPEADGMGVSVFLTALETYPAGRRYGRVRFFRPLRRHTPRGDEGIAPYAENAHCFLWSPTLRLT